MAREYGDSQGEDILPQGEAGCQFEFQAPLAIENVDLCDLDLLAGFDSQTQDLTAATPGL